MEDLNRGEIFNVRIKLRESYNGRELKPKAKTLEGQTFSCNIGWLQDNDDLYPNEYTFLPRDRRSIIAFTEADITWISQGDLEIIESV